MEPLKIFSGENEVSLFAQLSDEGNIADLNIGIAELMCVENNEWGNRCGVPNDEMLRTEEAVELELGMA